ncbi:RnfABCDGE type electron transport complex subunit G [Thermosipho ferrireducens]|uniref:Ion-translocating oxidoreductase complex subunit G n=1 Tax=Thermosipho ferrireducens TaxID=2571116 RepID=A0ABX7S828_9BACT|nr:RnfABCDGE type electron transport complex subunit G [Thermosipho ferrireducens]QTA38001.1 RnfABCDGE type electron transport complex subunit G [Thermosipho ferrireducens]
MKNIIKTGVTLMLFTLVAGVILGLIYNLAKPAIDQAELNNTLKALEFVLTHDGKLLIDKNILVKQATEKAKEPEKVLYTYEGGTVISPVFKFETSQGTVYVLKGYGIGYGGKVITVASFYKNGDRIDLHAIKVIEYSQETPGLGAKISENESQERFYPMPYEGLKNGVLVDKDARKSFLKPEEAKKLGIVKISDVMTGATITPRAVASTLTAMFKYLSSGGVK